MNELIKMVDDVTLWEVVSDVLEVIGRRGYKMDRSDPAFMIWYRIYKNLEEEINNRMGVNFTEG